jgi:predicted nucleic acid-binding protein
VSRIFVDTAYYVGVLLPRDDLHAIAAAVTANVQPAELVTSDAVLVEVLAQVSGLGPHARQTGIDLVRRLLTDENVTVIHQDRSLFEAAVDLYEQRPDKGYSLTDCMSMIICRDLEISDVLTHDRHFVQEGFTILL